jgi:hypothetical protein
MGEFFQHRLIISGFEVEYFYYKDKSIYRGYGARTKREKVEDEIVPKDEKVQEAKAQSSVNRTRKEIRRRINSNPQLTKFLTLTFRDEITEMDIANPKFNLFTQRAKDKWPEFQYLAVPEFQKSGRVHYHLLCNLRYVLSHDIEKVWGEGFINIRRLHGNLGWYLCKYLQKDMFDKRMFRKKKYFCSQDLAKSREIVGKKAQEFLKGYSHNLKLMKATIFHNEFIGEVEFTLLHFRTRSLDLKWSDEQT